MALPQDKGSKGGPREFGSDDDRPRPTRTGQIPIQTAPPKTATGQIPVQAAPPPRTTSGAIPAQPAPPAPAPAAPLPPGHVVGNNPFNLTQHQKQSMKSGFMDTAQERKVANVLGAPAKPRAAAPADDAPPEVTTEFDGSQAPEELQRRDLWKAVQPPVTSVPGKRSAELTAQVIHQFAVRTNPRYAPDGDKPRAHIFVWDVSRAMGCEVPHFAGAKELTLAQTCDWVRHEGPMRGWQRVAQEDTFGMANEGRLVVAVPREIKLKFIAIVAPQDPPNDNRPLLTGACRQRSDRATLSDMFGVRLVDYFTHP